MALGGYPATRLICTAHGATPFGEAGSAVVLIFKGVLIRPPKSPFWL
jgi:hypothetical protein